MKSIGRGEDRLADMLYLVISSQNESTFEAKPVLARIEENIIAKIKSKDAHVSHVVFNHCSYLR